MKYIKYGVIGLIVVLLIVGIISVKNFFAPKSEFNTNSAAVVKEMRALNRLETASFTLEKVIDNGASGNQLQEILFGDRILLIAHGEVVAGFDLSSFSDKNVSVDGRTIRITLPPPQILSTKLDSQQTRVYDRRQGLLSGRDKDLESKARATAETSIHDAACKGNILDEASKNARNQLTALFKTLGFTTVIIDIPQGGC